MARHLKHSFHLHNITQKIHSDAQDTHQMTKIQATFILWLYMRVGFVAEETNTTSPNPSYNQQEQNHQLPQQNSHKIVNREPL